MGPPRRSWCGVEGAPNHGSGRLPCLFPRGVCDNTIEVNAQLHAMPEHFHEDMEDGVLWG